MESLRHQLELVMSIAQETIVRDIESILTDLQVVLARRARTIDPMAVLAVSATMAKLINELLTLKKELSKRACAPNVTVKNLRGELTLAPF